MARLILALVTLASSLLLVGCEGMPDPTGNMNPYESVNHGQGYYQVQGTIDPVPDNKVDMHGFQIRNTQVIRYQGNATTNGVEGSISIPY